MRLSNGDSGWVVFAGIMLIGLIAGVRAGRGAQGTKMRLGVWRFLPCGKDGKSDYSGVDVDDRKWLPCSFPHAGWEQAQPGNNVFGWYRYTYRVPGHLLGRDLVVDLGIIDDVDAVYVNGARIGSTGEFPPRFRSAWVGERLYRARSATGGKKGDVHVLAVRVFDAGGLGGILGVPAVGVALAPSSSQWLFKACGPYGNVDFSALGVDDSKWEKIPIPDRRLPWPETLAGWDRAGRPQRGWDARQPQDYVYGWYRLHFSAPIQWRGKRLLLDLGRVYDVDVTYLNGTRIGGSGRFPPTLESEAGARRCYTIPEGVLRYGENNVLAVHVFDGEGMGGLVGIPMIRLNSEPEGPGAWVTPDGVSRGADTLCRSEGDSRTIAMLRQLVNRSEAEAIRARALAELVPLLQRAGKNRQAVEAFEQLLRRHPAASCRRRTIRALIHAQNQQGPFTPGLAYVGEDRETSGDWSYVYGGSGYILCNLGYGRDLYGSPGFSGRSNYDAPLDRQDPRRPMQYVPHVPTKLYRQMWMGAWRTKRKAGLLAPDLERRCYAGWDDQGEQHPFDNNGPDLCIDLKIPCGRHRLLLYFVDWSWWRTARPCQFGITVCKRGGTLLAAAMVSDFAKGVYEIFDVCGPADVVVRIYKHESAACGIQGIFLDPCPRLSAMQDALPPACRAEGRGAVAELQREFAGLARKDSISIALPPIGLKEHLQHVVRALREGKNMQEKVILYGLAISGWRRLGTELQAERNAVRGLREALVSIIGPQRARDELLAAASKNVARNEFHMALMLAAEACIIEAEAGGEERWGNVLRPVLGEWQKKGSPYVDAALLHLLDVIVSTDRPAANRILAEATLGEQALRMNSPTLADRVVAHMFRHYAHDSVVAAAGRFLERRGSEIVNRTRNDVRAGRVQDALPELHALLGQAPPHGAAARRARGLLARAQCVAGDFRGAIETAAPLLSAGKVDSSFEASLGVWAAAVAYAACGESEQSISISRRLFECHRDAKNPQFRELAFQAQSNVAELHREQGRMAEAAKALRMLAEAFPGRKEVKQDLAALTAGMQLLNKPGEGR